MELIEFCGGRSGSEMLSAIGRFATHDEAAQHYIHDYEPDVPFSIGKSSPLTSQWAASGHAEDVIERMAEHACDRVGDCADAWLFRQSKEEVKVLDDMLSNAILCWMLATNNRPEDAGIAEVVDIIDYNPDGSRVAQEQSNSQ